MDKFEVEDFFRQIAEASFEAALKNVPKEEMETVCKVFSLLKKYGFYPVQSYMFLLELGEILKKNDVVGKEAGDFE